MSNTYLQHTPQSSEAYGFDSISSAEYEDYLDTLFLPSEDVTRRQEKAMIELHREIRPANALANWDIEDNLY